MVEVAALATVGWVLSPLISKLVSKASSHFGCGDSDKKLKALETELLPKIQAVINAAEITPVDGMEPWLRELREAAFEEEDVLDEQDYDLVDKKVKRHQQVSGAQSYFIWLRANAFNKIAKKGKKIVSAVSPKSKLCKCMDRLEKSAARVDFFFNLLSIDNVIKKLKVSTGDEPEREPVVQRPPTSSQLLSTVFGQDEERDSLINVLISEGPECRISNWSVPVIAIYGLGGAGKTTFAQYTYNDRRVSGHFDKRMWVHASCEFDVFAVVKEMIESVTGGSTQHISNLDTLLMTLKENLKSKKFSLVLNDVWWNEPVDMLQYWD